MRSKFPYRDLAEGALALDASGMLNFLGTGVGEELGVNGSIFGERQMSEWTARQYVDHYTKVAEHYRDAAILIRGDLTAWKHERRVQGETDRECDDGYVSPDYYRADGAVRAINHLASKADSRRRKFEELALVAGYGDLDELARSRSMLSR